MEDKYILEGKLVSVFLRGSWEFTGRVEYSSKDKVVLLSDMGSLVIYKENIVAAMIIDETKVGESIDPKPSPRYDSSIRARNSRPPTLRLDPDSDQQDHYGSVIPEDMLEGVGDQTPVSFSLSFGELKNVEGKESVNGPGQKDAGYRRKD